jgi:hypothetical protein
MPAGSDGSAMVRRRGGRVGRQAMFLFFSNRLGCFGSLMLSAVVTLVLLLAFGVIRLD